MRAVIQRVREARVVVAGDVVGEIGRGILVLLGVGRGDTDADAAWLATRVASLRIFEDAEGKMNLALRDAGGSALVVSQFTLYGDCRKGRRPGFDRAAEPGKAERLYRHFVDRLAETGLPVATGRFGAQMQVFLVNDGPVTLLIDSERIF